MRALVFRPAPQQHLQECNHCTSINMPTIQRIGTTTIRVNVPDHRPAHVHVVLADRRDALVVIDTLQVVNRTLQAGDISEALGWIAANRAVARRISEENNP